MGEGGRTGFEALRDAREYLWGVEKAASDPADPSFESEMGCGILDNDSLLSTSLRDTNAESLSTEPGPELAPIPDPGPDPNIIVDPGPELGPDPGPITDPVPTCSGARVEEDAVCAVGGKTDLFLLLINRAISFSLSDSPYFGTDVKVEVGTAGTF